jgi:hypothetical protein
LSNSKCTGTKQELVSDLINKAKQVEQLINSLPVPEPEEQQVARLAQLQSEMAAANEEYRLAVKQARLSSFLEQLSPITDVSQRTCIVELALYSK